MPVKLTEEQIKQKLRDGRNYKRLYFELKNKYDDIKIENRQLKAENIALRAMVAEQQATIETLKIQIAELQTMVFGKKKQPPTGHHDPLLTVPVALPRSKDSYRRPIPPVAAITAEKPVPLPKTCSCGGSFTRLTTHERYEEDIPLPDLTKNYTAHLVTKFLVERGVCGSCAKATSGRELGGQAVRLGPNVRLLVTHLIAVMGLSYAQIIQLFGSLYDMHLTDGEIAAIVAAQHKHWLPAYEQLKADIRAGPSINVDETSWPIQSLQGQGYGWVLAASNSSKSCFALENSRGARHARKLLGDYRGIRITDDYAVYRSLPGNQQLCWVHLYRTIKDLRYNENLPEEQLTYVSWWYEQFAAVHQRLRAYLAEPYDQKQRYVQAEELWQWTRVLCPSEAGEPAKLANLKAQLTRAGKNRLFVCLLKDIPCENNRAERDLRPLVIKRKRCFGSKSIKGAKALATVLSICTNTWRENPNSYFKTLAAIG